MNIAHPPVVYSQAKTWAESYPRKTSLCDYNKMLNEFKGVLKTIKHPEASILIGGHDLGTLYGDMKFLNTFSPAPFMEWVLQGYIGHMNGVHLWTDAHGDPTNEPRFLQEKHVVIVGYGGNTEPVFTHLCF